MKPQSIIQKALDKGISLFVEDGKLGFKMAKGAQFPNELKALIKTHKGAVIEYFEQAKAQYSGETTEKIELADRNQSLPLSFAQQRMWFIDQMEQGSAVYNMPLALKIKGELNPEIAEQAINLIIERHEILRTVIVERDGEVQQVVQTGVEFTLPVVDLSAMTSEDQQKEVTELINQNAGHIFDLASDLMLTASFIRCRSEAPNCESHDYLLFNVHHIASDGWSQSLLLKEFTVIYQALSEGREHPLPALQVQYADFANWQRNQLKGDVIARQLDYWQTQLAGLPEVHGLPLDFPRGQNKTHEGGLVSNNLPAQLSNTLEAIARSHEMTPFMLLHGAISLLFARHSYNHDIVIGTPVAGRKTAELNDIIGLFVNTLVLRVDTDKPTLADFLHHVRQVNLDAQAHQDIPFEQLVEQAQVTRTTAHTPLFQIMFSMNTNEYANVPVTGLEAEIVSSELENVKFDMDISARFDENGLHLNWVFDKALFSEGHIARMSEHLMNMLTSMVETFNQSPQVLSSIALGELNMLSAQERDEILTDLSQPDVEEVEILDSMFYQRFEHQAETAPDNIALRHVAEDGQQYTLSYGELNRKANQWALYISSLGVQHQSNVGLCLNRGLDMIVAILAIHKLGASYVSLDPSYPQARLDYIVEDTRSPVVLIHKAHSERLSFEASVAVAVVDSEDFVRDTANLPDTNIEPVEGYNDSDLALIIYTSGSTGKPKGVMLTQRNIMALLDWGVGCFSEEELSFVFAGTSLNFDLSIFELFTPLSIGGSCVLAESILSLLDTQHQDNEKASAFEGITLVNSVPSAVGAVVAATQLPKSVTTVITAGEAMTQGLAQRLYQQPGVKRVVSLYGPTEDTVYSSSAEVNRDEQGRCEVPNLGRMFPHSQGYVVDIFGQLAGIGCIGQLFIGGEGLARGYWRRPELTAERFIQADPALGVKGRLYISGDLIHYLPNGQMKFVARVDQQVKIRGFRIELGEIESQLLADEGVSKAAMAVYHHEGHPQLAAYVVPRDSNASEAFTKTLIAKLADQLPHYMVPSIIVLLEQLPYMPNGKLDKKALPAINGDASNEDNVAPANDVEKVLADIWADVLGKPADTLSVNRNFFALGGDSILSIQVVSRALQKGLRFTIKDMFNAQTIQQLALVAQQGGQIDAEQGLITGNMPLLPIHNRFFGQTEDLHHYNQAVMLTTQADFTFSALEQITAKLVEHHDALRLRYHENEGKWQGQFVEFDQAKMAQAIEHRCFNETREIEAYADKVQASLSLTEGRLFKAVLFTKENEQGRLLLVFHHLIVDGVSWRILLEDINGLYEQVLANKALSLPAKTSSYQRWAQWLGEYRQSDKLLSQQAYWENAVTTVTSNSVLTKEGSESTHGKAPVQLETARMQLSTADTEALLSACNNVYRTEINELLLAGLLLAFERTTGSNAISIDLEGHGREALAENIDLSRTVGWFTSLYPLSLKLSQSTIADAINSAKRAYRGLPDNGIGFGLLSEIEPQLPLYSGVRSEVVFNYLGQFNQGGEQNSRFGFAEESTGQHISPNRYPSHPLALNGLIAGEQLSFSLAFDSALYEMKTMQKLMDAYAQALSELVAHCAELESAPLIACDFPLAQFDDEAFVAVGLSEQHNIADIYPATKMQQGLLFHSILTEGQYVTQMEVTFIDLDIEQMQKAWQQVVDHNEVFRTGFIGLAQGNAHQVVYQDCQVPWQNEDISGLDNAAQDARVSQVMAQHKQQGFDQDQAPLMRVSAFDCGGRQRLVWSFHHALVDGWSLPLVFAQLVESYQNLVTGKQAQLAPVKPFHEHVKWLMAQDVVKATEYWREQVESVEATNALPLADNTSIEQKADDCHIHQLRLDEKQSAQLQQLAQQCSTTVNVIVQAAWALILGRHNGAEQVVFGATNSGRPPEIAGVDKMIGLFINTLPVVINIEQSQGIKAWLTQLHKELVEREAYSYLPLTEILALRENREALFDSILVFENYPVDEAIGEASEQANLQVENVQTYEGTNYGLTLMAHFTDALSIRFMAQKRKYSEEALLTLSNQVKQLLLDFCATENVENRAVSQLQLQSKEQQQQLLQRLNVPAQSFEQSRALHQLFEAQAVKTPDSPALCALENVDKVLSYRELNESANRLAHYLKAKHLKESEQPFVGICLNRGVDSIIAILAVLKAGGCYVPLDPNYPQQRLAYIAKDTGLKVLLAERDTVENLTAISVQDEKIAVCLLDDELLTTALSDFDSDNPDVSVDAEQPAYVIYTSGSTGQPKGVLINHRNVGALLNWSQNCFGTAQMAKVLVSTSFNFDLSIFEVFAPLAVGGQCVVADSILQVIEEREAAKGLTLINTVPSGISALLGQNAIPESVTTVNLAGEPLPRAIVTQLYQTGHISEVYNLYGPSEDTTYSLYSLVPDDDSLPLIGRPITNTIAYVVDNSLNIAAPGVVGELYLAGEGVALGYLNRPDLTEEKFIADPFAHLHQLQVTDKAYKTGDLVRYREQKDCLGSDSLGLEFIGRADNQVKLRGFRIEPGEIEHQLCRLDTVESALVVVIDSALVAYLVMNEAFASESLLNGLKETLAASLPAHMVPNVMLPLHAWPLTPNGKIDKSKLPLASELSNDKTRIAPQSEVEQKLLTIWADLLRLDEQQISIDDNFHRLGGDSILSLQVVSSAMREGLFFTVKDLFEAPTIAGLAKRVNTAAQQSVDVPDASGEQLLLPIQQAFAENLTDWHHYNQSVMLKVPADFSIDMLRKIVHAWYEQHDVLRLVFTPTKDGLSAQYRTFDAQTLISHINESVLSVSTEQADFANSTAFADSIQQSLSPTTGELFKAVLVESEGDEQGRLLLVMHHLIVDGVSWRVLLEQLMAMYAQIKQSREIALPNKSNSYQQWSNWLESYAKSAATSEEIVYWQNVAQRIEHTVVASDDNAPKAHERQFEIAQFGLDSTLSEQLLGECNQTYRTQINELLLAAIYCGVNRLTQANDLVIALEGHGRETLNSNLDIAQTLGWFTTLYPFAMSVECDKHIGNIICSVKEQYRQVPNKGLGFGALKYLAQTPQLTQSQTPELLFNYLGQFEQVVNEQSDFYWAEESTGRMVSDKRHSNFGLTINGLQTVDGLSFTLSYDASRYSEQVITALISHLQQSLQLVAEHCLEAEGRFTPSDFPLANVDGDTLSQWQQAYDIADLYPASGMQQGLLFQSMLHQGSYTNQKIFTFVDLDLVHFEAAWQQVIKGHDVFRTGFVGLDNGQAHQLVHGDVQLPWHYQDLSHLSEEAQASFVEQFRAKDKAEGFDISKPPLMRIAVFDLGNNRHQLLWSVHHALLDGWCLPLVFAEVTEYYRTLKSGQRLEDLAPTKASYKDYIAWLGEQDLTESEAYWSDLLSDFEHKTPLPLVNASVDVEQSSHSHSLAFDEGFTDELREFAKTHEVTLNVLVQGAWALMLSQYHLAPKGQNTVVFGAVTSGRPPALEGVESIVGLFINSIPVVVEVDNNLTLSQWLKIMHQNLVAGESHAHLPLKDIQSVSPASEGLFDSLLVFENYPVDETIGAQAKEAALNVEAIENFEGTDDAMALVVHTAGRLTMELTINKGLTSFDHGEKLINQLQTILTAMMQSADKPMAQLSLLADKEQQSLLELAGTCENGKDYSGTMLSRFEQVVESHAEQIAIDEDGNGLSYRQLDNLANHFALVLEQNGVTPGQMVGICAPRSKALIVAMLAVMKAGCTYVPLSADYPVERLAHMCSDTGLSVALCFETSLPESLNIKEISLSWDASLLEQPAKSEVKPSSGLKSDSLAYVMYTSGSTGLPKGVMVTHQNVLRCVYGDNSIEINEQSKVVYCANPAFDASTWEIWTTLLHGASLIIVNDEQLLNVDLLEARLVSSNANVLQLTAGLFRTLAEPLKNTFKQLDYLLIGGDKPDISAVRTVVESGGPKHFIHTYGPTESVAFTTVFEITKDAVDSGWLPIGRATYDSQSYVLDHNQQLVPQGAIGLLHIGGSGVANGYLNREALTAEAFIANPFGAGKLYNTGDLVRLDDKGDIVFVGRQDEQVKVRGYRIELGEIEHHLNRCDGVKSSLVRVLSSSSENDKDKRLLGYIQAEKGVSLDVDSLREQLLDSLPSHMVPGMLIAIEDWPLTANGKVDVRALPQPQSGLLAGDYTAPGDETEAKLQHLWAELLQLSPEQVSTTANFFALGGDSILSIQLVARAAKQGLHFSVKDLFDAPTVKALAASVCSERQLLAEQGELTGSVPLLPVQQAFLADQTDWHHVNQSVMLETDANFDEKALPAIVKALYQKHDALRLRFELNEDKWSSSYQPFDEQMLSNALSTVVLAQPDWSDLTGQADKVQRSLAPANGNLFKAVYFKQAPSSSEKAGRLLLVIHHLAVDGVSWRVLLDDVQTLYRQYQQGEVLDLGQKTTSYRQWAELLASDAASEHFSKQIDYWRNAVNTPAIELADGDFASGNFQTARMELDEQFTTDLLTLCADKYRAQINELLLAALLLGARRFSGEEKALTIELESHGRDVVSPLETALNGLEADLSQTIGWFTQSYPMLLDSDSMDIGRLINQIKTRYRQVPDGGLGFGILKYLHKVPELAGSSLPILFNYLGQFNQTTQENSAFTQAKESVGTQVSERRARSHGLAFNGMVSEGALWFEVAFDDGQYSADTVNGLLSAIKTSLEDVVNHCRQAINTELVAVDFPYTDATDDDIAQWQACFDIADLYPATGTQQGLLFHSMLHSGRYVTQTLVYLRDLDVSRLEKSWQLLIEHHDIFRTAFVGQEQGRAQQLVVKEASVQWQLQDWSGLTKDQREQALEAFLAQDKLNGFDSEQAPLLRFNLFDLGNSEHCLVWSHHHAIMDGWSLPLIFTQIRSIYASLAATDDVAELKASLPHVQYGAYAKWLAAKDNDASLKYWTEQLADITEVTPLPMVSTQVASDEHKEALQYSTNLSEAQTHQLVEMAKQANTTVGVILQAAWACLLNRYTSREQLVFGATTSGRPPTLAGVEQMVGLFINTVPVSVDLSEQGRFIDLVKLMHNQQATRELHSHIPLVEIQRQSVLKQNLFETIVVFENYPMNEMTESQSVGYDLQVDSISFVEDSNFGLNLVAHLEAQLSLQLLVHDSRYEQQQVNQLVEGLAEILVAIGQNAQRPIQDLIATKHQNAVAVGEQREVALRGDLASQFEHQAELTPQNTAVSFENDSFTYAELNTYAHRFAAVLEENGIEQGQLVGVYFNRSLSMVVTLLALSKLGAVFVALEPSQPDERIATIIEDADIETVVTSEDLVGGFGHSGVDVVVIEDFAEDPDAFSEYDEDELPERELTADDLAYVLYTSGSSGKPKGVKIKHSGLMNYLDHGVNQYMVDGVAGSVVSSPLCFDATLTTLLVPLMCGGSVTLLGDDDVLFTQLADKLMASDTPLLFKLTPAHMTVLLSFVGEKVNENAHRIIIGGEQLTVNQLEPWLNTHLPNSHFINEYGPTETVVGCCIYDVCSAAQLAGIKTAAVPVGLPIQNTQLYVTDNNLQPVPKGAIGQLFIAGAGVCDGYLNRDELTEEVLVDVLPSQISDKAYRSGDLVIYHEEGVFEFIGRNDEQVKVNGYRIELADIEYHLNADEQVKQALVNTWQSENGNSELVAYVQWHKSGDFSRLSTLLASKLPSYMVPQHFISMDEWPLTVNGKVDRRALPAPAGEVREQEKQQPQNALEQKLLDIWQQALQSDDIGVTDSFFQAGGDSILALTVIGLCRQQGIEFTVSELLQHGSIRVLAEHLEAQGMSTQNTIEIAPFELLNGDERDSLDMAKLDDAYPQTLLQQGMIFHTMQAQLEGVYHDISTVSLKLQWNEAAFTQALVHLVERHDILRAVFDMTTARPLVLVQREIDLPLHIEDWRHLSPEQQQSKMAKWLDAEKCRVIDMAKSPWQIAVQRLTEEEVCFHISFHHALLDGWSRASLETELFETYHQMTQGNGLVEQQMPLPYRYFVGLEGEALENETAKRHWMDIVQAAPMPWWNGAANRGNVYHVDFSMDESKADAIGALAKQLSVQEKSVLMALHVVICGLLDGETKVLTSSVYNTRPEQVGSELTLGLFLNALPLSVDFAQMRWRELIEYIDTQQLAGVEHRYYPVTDIQQQSGVDLSGSLFNFVDFHVYDQVSQSADMVSRSAFDRNNYWLQSAFERGDNGSLSVGLILDSGVFDPTLFEQLKGPIQQLLNDFVDSVDEAVPTSFTPKAPSPVLIEQGKDTLTVWQQFEKVATTAPGNCAVRFGEQSISYGELAEKALFMAAHLSEQGLQGEVIALHCKRDINMVIALLAACRAGIAYVPVDPSLPETRKATLIEKAGCRVIVSDEQPEWLGSSVQVVSAQNLFDGLSVDELSQAKADIPLPKMEDAAYVIFTSGSTGEPKGVEVSHGALACHLAGVKQRINDLGCTSHWLAVTTLSFDIAGLEIFAPLLAGAELLVADEQQSKDPQALAQLIERQQITHLQATPATWTALVDYGWMGSSKLTALCGGEALTVNLAEQLLGKVSKLYNCYGPTEATIWSMIAQVTLADLNRHQIELNGTLPGYAHSVVNQFGQPVPHGIPGQLCIAGNGLANGYFNNQALTDKAFIERENSDGIPERWYLTGDNVIQTGKDRFTYLGRIDHQVKINGHRVELGEIQYQANSCDLVRESVVTSYQDAQGFTVLALYVVPSESSNENQEPLESALRGYLSQRLPRYMVPNAIVVLDAMPINANGKVDLKQLEKPQLSRREPMVEPATEVEQQLALLWSELLGIEVSQVSIKDDFFLSGGHSLLVVQLLSRVRKQFGFEIELTRFMANASIEGLSAIVEEQQALEAVTQGQEKMQTISF